MLLADMKIFITICTRLKKIMSQFTNKFLFIPLKGFRNTQIQAYGNGSIKKLGGCNHEKISSECEWKYIRG